MATVDELAEPMEGGARRGWLMPAVAVAVVVLLILAYRHWFTGGGSQTPAETVAVTRTTIRSTIEASGSVESQESASLSFVKAGRVNAIAVKLGDRVEAGQLLASMDSDDADAAVLAAGANLQLARLTLTQLINGASAAEIAGAQQSVSAAQAARDKSADALRQLEEGASAADLDAARAAVTKAEAALAESEDALERLRDGASDADLAAARAGVASAEAALASAERAAENAASRVASAEAGLLSARSAYCLQALARAEVCPTSAIPLPRSTLELLLDDAAGTSDAALASAISSLLTANTGYVTATEAAASAADAVDVAESNLAASEEKLDKLRAGADAAQVDAAEAAVGAATAGLSAARSRLADVEDGASPEEQAVARSALAAADDALAAARAKLDDLLDGSDADDVALLRAKVSAAEIGVQQAQVQQAHTRLLAPFGGVVAAVNVHAGEYLPAAAPAFVLLTPGALRLNLVIGENDRPYVSVGQQGTITFDAAPSQAYAFAIQHLGESPKIEQGVATYVAEATLIVPADAERPITGMSGVAEVLLTEKTAVLAIPTRALRRIGREQVADVMANGAIEERTVETGISDGQYVEVISGLEEGDQVLLRAVTGAAPVALPTRERLLPGGVR
ncbi:MAG: HlyD family efflux transporter periplasmic adaptor subunit [Chloroflexi bacterium]|nr:HlyD family efflux transporter periplasmic adaptor subunit [Chloroflexota bacterium]